ncbi:hypothetical protein, partial [Enorma massiliensis]|uniref:hypothetical protein n=1 Tax=Enorma massiliensis TaxID=1472761 RepID=UPI003AB8AEC1
GKFDSRFHEYADSVFPFKFKRKIKATIMLSFICKKHVELAVTVVLVKSSLVFTCSFGGARPKDSDSALASRCVQ